MTEREWQQQVVELAHALGWTSYHTLDSRGSTHGWPDLVLVRPPRALFVELKTDKGRVSPAQQDWLDSLAACNLEVHVWRPADFDQVHAALRGVRAVTFLVS